MRLSFMTSVKACAKRKDLHQGSKIHAHIRACGLLENDTCLGNMLLSMYAKCGALVRAQQVFDELPVRNVVSWTALIAGYVQHGHGWEALGCFHQMRSHGFSPDAITYACTLKACGIVQDVHVGEQIHDEIVTHGLLKRNIMLGGALVDMYSKCGVLLKAQKFFDALPVHSAVSWTALIAGYAQHRQGEEALNCYQRMWSQGFAPDAITYACILKACSIVQDVDVGKQIHDEIVNQGLLKSNIVLGNALVDMYAKCGALSKAENFFDLLRERNVVSWTAMIAGYTQHGQGQEALGCFQQMQSQGFSPNAITYACALKACGIMQDSDVGKQIHDKIVRQGLLKNNAVLGNALIDVYVKCGVLLKARQVLDELPVRDAVSWTVLIAGYGQQGQGHKALGCLQQMWSEGFSPDAVCWNALIGGYAQQGLAKEALNCFQWMQQEGISPDASTFLNVLNACSHSGLVDEGQMYFNSMRKKYNIAPNKEHYTCMVDLFGRARLFDKAMTVVRTMPLSEDHRPVWSALLAACEKWENVKLGRFAFEHAVQVDRCNAATYVLMSNIYAAAGMQEEANDIECMRIRNAAWKQPGCGCWADTSENAHKFVVGESKHPQSPQIYVKFQELSL